MKKIAAAVLTAASIAAAPASDGAEAEENPAMSGQSLPPVIETKLDNGLTLLVLERKMSPTVAFHIFFKVGNVDAPSGKTGLAHLFEHMAFKGTKTVGTKDYEKEKPLLDAQDSAALEINLELAKGQAADQSTISSLEAKLKGLAETADGFVVDNEFQKIYDGIGAEHFNAMTGSDFTGYVVSLPANRLEAWMAIESDRFKTPVFRQFYKERDVVTEEMRMSDSRPEGLLYKTLLATAFAAHPYRNPIVGWESDLRKLTGPDMTEQFKNYYGPNNAVLSIVGDVDAAKTLELVKKYFGGIPARPLPAISPTEEPPQKGEKRASVVFDAQPEVWIAFKQPETTHKDYPVFVMLNGLLSKGRTSRFYKNLVEGKELAVSVESEPCFAGERYPTLFAVIAKPKAPHSLDELEAAVYAELDKLKTAPPAAQELEKIVNQSQSEILQSMDSNEGLSFDLGYSRSLFGDWQMKWKLLEDLKKVTPRDISRVAAQYLTKENRTVVRLEPSEKGDKK